MSKYSQVKLALDGGPGSGPHPSENMTKEQNRKHVEHYGNMAIGHHLSAQEALQKNDKELASKHETKAAQYEAEAEIHQNAIR